MCSPRTRGWSRGGQRTRRGEIVLPAHAGMVPIPHWPGSRAGGAPRARGDGPKAHTLSSENGKCSPRTRGWSGSSGFRPRMTTVLPAHAGMVPARRTTTSSASRAPRARGDGPGVSAVKAALRECSPRTRGWSPAANRSGTPLRVLPAHAGMVPPGMTPIGSGTCAPRARGDGPRVEAPAQGDRRCSPRTRGWSPRAQGAAGNKSVLPAHAGMVPSATRASRVSECAPRARGDGPNGAWDASRAQLCSPRTRGWSQLRHACPSPRLVLPAHAGMVPPRRRTSAQAARAPRARGDGPWGTSRPRPPATCSPRTRGWSPRTGNPLLRDEVLPAHAGMVPWSAWNVTPWFCAPRARGDGPLGKFWSVGSWVCSPRTRGWSQKGLKADQVAGVLPRTRGWSRQYHGRLWTLRVLPYYCSPRS